MKNKALMGVSNIGGNNAFYGIDEAISGLLTQ
jgi:hypothetical protein